MNSDPQRSQVRGIFLNVKKTVDSWLQKRPNSAIVLADYGSSDGNNSLGWINEVIKIRDEHIHNNTKHQLHIILVDLETNDWNYMWKQSGKWPADGIFFSSIGRSFYHQLLPDSSVHVGISATSFHWLSNIPDKPLCSVLCHLSDQVENFGFWKKQAKEDWNKLLLHRSKELVPGGTLIVTGLCWKDDGGAFNQIFRLLDQAFKLIVVENIVSPQCVELITVPAYIRTIGEYGEFDQSIPLKVIHSEVYDDISPIYAEFLKHGNTDEFAKQFTMFIRAAYEPVLIQLTRLEGQHAENTMKMLWQKFEQLLRNYSKEVAIASFINLVLEKY